MSSPDRMRPASHDPGRRVSAPAVIRTTETATTTHVFLGGDIDAETETTLAQIIDSASSRGLPIEVDTREVTFMDSTGAAFLAMLGSRSPAAVTLVDPPAIVRFLVQATGIAALVNMPAPDATSGDDS